MSKMLANIFRIVTEDISSRVAQYDVIFEAITNAIQANATKITCTLTSLNHGIEIKKGARKKVDIIAIQDNGEGFDTTNYESFCEHRTQRKKDLGCKGVGRFVYLKVYKNVEIKSSVVKEQEERTFTFNFDFKTENLSKKTADVKENLTEIRFTSLETDYIDLIRDLDRRIYLDLSEIRERVLLHLIPTLFFYKRKGTSVVIDFVDEETKETLTIGDSDIPNFTELPFIIEDRDHVKNKFVLFHAIDQVKGRLHAFHCANSRTVCEFSDKDLKVTLPFGYSGFFLLESPYLDSHVNNERNEYDIFPVKTDIYSPISWEMINNSLKDQIASLIKTVIPNTETVNRQKLQEIEEERPYLINYIDEKDLDIAGFLDKKTIIDKAKKTFDNAKEKVLANTKKTDVSDADLNEAIQIAQNELVAYIFDRVQIIERLKKMLDDKEKVESVIHNLFMQQYTEDDFYAIGKNNLWLLDDRFTSYTYAASDKKIHEVLRAVDEKTEGVKNPDDKPDLSLFFSHNPSQPERLKSVVIELKPFDTNDGRKKYAGIEQLLDYIEAFKSRDKIEEAFGFLVTDVDDDFAARLKRSGYKPLYSSHAPIWHRPYENGTSIYVVGAKTLIIDAEARNKVFLEIIKRQSRLHHFLNREYSPHASEDGTQKSSDKSHSAETKSIEEAKSKQPKNGKKK